METKNTRFDHSKCNHATSGTEGKKARAACRKAHALEAAKAAAAPAKKTRTRKVATPRAKAAAKATVPAAPEDEDLLVDL